MMATLVVWLLLTVTFRGSVRSMRDLGPTMTTRGQGIGISIGMLDKLIRTTLGLNRRAPSRVGLGAVAPLATLKHRLWLHCTYITCLVPSILLENIQSLFSDISAFSYKQFRIFFSNFCLVLNDSCSIVYVNEWVYSCTYTNQLNVSQNYPCCPLPLTMMHYTNLVLPLNSLSQHTGRQFSIQFPLQQHFFATHV
jgi:hypothetical protein